VTALGTVILAGHQIAAMMGGIVVTIVIVAPRIKELKLDRVILKDMAPFLVMGGGLLTANLLPVYRDWVRTVLVWTVEVVPGHVVYFRPLSDAYLYLLAAFVAGYLLLECDGTLMDFLRKGTVQGYRPLVAMALFGSMGQVISFTGATAGMSSVNAAKNIPAILADSMAGAGFLYPVLVPVLGWVGTFLTGYGVASIMLFAVLQKGIALRLGVSPELLIAGLAVGASLGSISSPFKIAFAASLSDAAGMEGDILRSTIPLGIIVCLALGVVLYLMV
jgi:lactate permease